MVIDSRCPDNHPADAKAQQLLHISQRAQSAADLHGNTRVFGDGADDGIIDRMSGLRTVQIDEMDELAALLFP
ncbi:hypothetical protein D3C75_1083400 [compost metagenome]